MQREFVESQLDRGEARPDLVRDVADDLALAFEPQRDLGVRIAKRARDAVEFVDAVGLPPRPEVAASHGLGTVGEIDEGVGDAPGRHRGRDGARGHGSRDHEADDADSSELIAADAVHRDLENQRARSTEADRVRHRRAGDVGADRRGGPPAVGVLIAQGEPAVLGKHESDRLGIDGRVVEVLAHLRLADDLIGDRLQTRIHQLVRTVGHPPPRDDAEWDSQQRADRHEHGDHRVENSTAHWKVSP